MHKADVFCLVDSNGQFLPPAVQATVLAKYSRSPLSAREILKTLTSEEADKFHDKYVVQYGHNSVAELSDLPVCFEGVSIVASKFIEAWQRPGYSEKSTRYQVFSGDSFIIPPGAPERMRGLVTNLYETYDKLRPRMYQHCAKLMGMSPDDKVVKARAFDNIRYLLPAGTGTNVAIVANLRDIREMTSKLRGHTNPEFRTIGEKLFSEATRYTPTLIKHADPNSFHLPIKSIGDLDPTFQLSHPTWYTRIHKSHLLPDPKLEQKSFEVTISDFHSMSWSAFSEYMAKRSDHDEVPDVFKTIKVSFELMMDYGAFRDLQRHRRCEQYVEYHKPDYGYLVPDDIVGSELESDYCQAMGKIRTFEDDILTDPDLSQYVVPLGYLHRSIFQMDLKELYYIIELRTAPRGHISYRRVAYKMFELARERWPQLMQWCRAQRPDAIGVHA